MPRTLRRQLGESYALYRLRVARGGAYTTEIQGILTACTQGGVILLIVKQYFHVLPPLWILPIIWVLQKAFEFTVGYLDEKHWHYWQFENRYNADLNPFNKELMAKVTALSEKV